MRPVQVYLAGPYSSKRYDDQVWRFKELTKRAAALMEAGVIVHSPITHSHPMAVLGHLPGDWEFWKRVDGAYISCCQALWVIMLDGWDTSAGVAAEVKIARELGIPVMHIAAHVDIGEYGRQWLEDQQAA
jgi:nucleoside 2-deoxyribosyltransferase